MYVHMYVHTMESWSQIEVCCRKGKFQVGDDILSINT
jgi:hypothetical protein